MATTVGTPYPGPFIIDLTDTKDELIDLPPGAMRGMRAEQPGFADVLTELAKAMPAHGDTLELPKNAYQRILAATPVIDTLRTRVAILAKALEVATESLAKKENDREDDISALCKSVREASERRRDPAAAAAFEKTLRYNAQIAEKGARTRRRKAESQAEGPKDT